MVGNDEELVVEQVEHLGARRAVTTAILITMDRTTSIG